MQLVRTYQVFCFLSDIALLGGRKIPELMKGLGEGIKNFKSGLKDADGKEDKGKEESSDKA